jgi:hypothetical protein
MATCRPTLFLLTVKEILLVHFIITNFRVAHKMLCTPWLRNPLTTSRLFCLGRKAALTTIFLSVRQSRISQPCYTNNYLARRKRPKVEIVRCWLSRQWRYSGGRSTYYYFGALKIFFSQLFRQFGILNCNVSDSLKHLPTLFQKWFEYFHRNKS